MLLTSVVSASFLSPTCVMRTSHLSSSTTAARWISDMRADIPDSRTACMPPPQFRHLARSLPVPSGSTPTGGGVQEPRGEDWPRGASSSPSSGSAAPSASFSFWMRSIQERIHPTEPSPPTTSTRRLLTPENRRSACRGSSRGSSTTWMGLKLRRNQRRRPKPTCGPLFVLMKMSSGRCMGPRLAILYSTAREAIRAPLR
mmetsp:Transcript_35862/g.101519  ORF Transcript_35862/g.101519 Transcript_35862/m.101519 type:complete len:200 (+) Transcript_35862:1062-1661(+)